MAMTTRPVPVLSPRDVSRQTNLAAAGVMTIAAPASAEGVEAAGRLREALGNLGLEGRLLVDPAPAVLHQAAGPVLLLGNLADSRCVGDLYYRLLCVTDRCYPGPGESRTPLRRPPAKRAFRTPPATTPDSCRQ